jgi:hypothetical protein
VLLVKSLNNSKGLINQMGLKFPKLILDYTLRYAAKWDEGEQLLIVDLELSKKVQLENTLIKKSRY